jgi:hypothetical protein
MREITETMREAFRQGGKNRMRMLKENGGADEFYRKATAKRVENYRKYKELVELHEKTKKKN